MEIRSLEEECLAILAQYLRAGRSSSSLFDLTSIRPTEQPYALEEENCNLRTLVCYLLHKNECLRRKICQQSDLHCTNE
jgi:hypothetical protein